MQRAQLIWSASALVALSTAVATCGDDPPSRVPSSPSEPSIATMAINGPGSVPPGQSAQFFAMTTLSDGSVKAASSATGVRWRSSNPSVLQVDATGLASAVAPQGEATLSVELSSSGGFKRSAKEVVVLPNGTFRMVGRVTEADGSSVGIPDAEIEVNPGGARTTADGSGEYQLYGVPPDAEVRVVATGFQTHVETVRLTDHSTRNFQLQLSGPRLRFNGPYTVGIEVVDGCPGGSPLPGDLQRRTYEAFMSMIGADVRATLTEPRFSSIRGGTGYNFTGRTTAAGATFTIGSVVCYYYYYGPTKVPGIVEQFSNGTHLAISGLATTTGTNDRQSGTLDGVMTLFDSEGRPLGECVGVMRFTLTRR